MAKNKNINLPAAEIQTSKVTKLGKRMGLQDQNLRMRHPLIRVHVHFFPKQTSCLMKTLSMTINQSKRERRRIVI